MWPYAIPPGYAPVSGAALGAGLAAGLRSRDAAVSGLETLLKERYPCDRLALVDSGTTALRLALRASSVDRPGPVALPAYSCYDLVSAAVGADADLLFYDLEPATLQPDLASLEEALRAGATRVVVAHLFGVPVDVRRVTPLLEPYGAGWIEDAAQGFGAAVGGRPAGSLAPLSVLSFNRGKGVTAGSGGALLARGREVSRRLAELDDAVPRGGRSLRPVAVGAASWALARPRVYGLPRALPFLRLGRTVYRPPREPGGLLPSAAGILTHTLPLTEAGLARQRERGRRLAGGLAGDPGLVVVGPPAGCRAGWLRLPVLLRSEELRENARAAVHLGIVRAYPRTLPDLREAASRTPGGGAFPGARELAEGLYTIPTHARVGGAELRRLEAWISART